jgi:hypothetical protein
VTWTVDDIDQTKNTIETLAPGNGVKTITRSAQDAAGNTGTATVQVTLDFMGYGLNNPPGKSLGCEKPTTMVTGPQIIRSGGADRDYQIDIPVNYNIDVPNNPPRLPMAWMSTTGMTDVTCPWMYNDAQRLGAK